VEQAASGAGRRFFPENRQEFVMTAVLPTYNRADIAFERGEGVYLFSESGDAYLDCGGGVAVNVLGHAHPHLVEAVTVQAAKLWHTSNLYRVTGQYERIFPLLTPLLALDVADEPVHRELMRAYALTGRRHDALRQYQTCVQALASELDLTPEPETAALYTQILNAQLRPSSSTQPTVKARGGSVRLEPSPFLVGREAEFETLRLWQESIQQRRGQTILIAETQVSGRPCWRAKYCARQLPLA
jgi:hypothetical protein